MYATENLVYASKYLMYATKNLVYASKNPVYATETWGMPFMQAGRPGRVVGLTRIN